MNEHDAGGLAAWLEARGARGVAVEELAGGASLRRYWRARGENLPGDAGRVVLMTLPPGGPASEELGKPGASAGDDFVAMARWLEAAGLPVPQLFEAALDQGIVCLEDLGDERLFDQVRGLSGHELEAAYAPALDLLVAFQNAVHTAPETSPGHAKCCDEPVLAAELQHFIEYGLEARHAVRLGGRNRRVLDGAFADIARRLAGAPYALAHRDFQSQNLMCTPRGLVLIDFQDAFLAPAVYDLVALLRDSYVVLPPATLERLLVAYHGRRLAAALPGEPLADPGRLSRLFHLQTVQRKLKDAGRFEYIHRVKGDPGFLRYYADSVRYAASALARFPEYAEALTVLQRLAPETRTDG